MSTATPIDTAAVLKLPVAQKRALLDALLGDQQAHGMIDLTFPDGPVRIYKPVPKARELAERSWQNATPEELAESARRAATPDDSVSVEEMLVLIREDVERDEK